MALTDPGHTLFGNKLFAQERAHVIVGGKPTHNRTSNAIFTTRTQRNRSLFTADDTFPQTLIAGGRNNPYNKACCETGFTNATNEAYDNSQTHFNYPYRNKGANFFSGGPSNGNQLTQCCGVDIAAYAVLSFDQNATVGNVLSITSTDGTTKFFKAASSTSTAPDGDTAGTALEFKHSGSSAGAEVIAALRVCLVAANGFGSAGVKIIVGVVVGTQLTLTQTVKGSAGNTVITSDVDNLSINGGAEATDGAFIGGEDGKTY